MAKVRTVIWKPVDYEGIEHFTLREQDDRVQAEGVVVGIENQAAFRLDYRLVCDTAYRVQELNVSLAGHGSIQYTSDGQGTWFNPAGQPVSELQGCLDVDISATPFTNTLPVKRVPWEAGKSETLNMIYVTIPDFTVRVDVQRYTCVEMKPKGGLFRFQSLNTGFEALIPVDEDGLVLDYPGLFSRVWSS